MEKQLNELQKAMNQIGQDVVRYLPKGMKAVGCDLHGRFLTHYSNTEALCPLCIKTGTGEGVTATEMEHWINLKDTVERATGFRPQG